MLLAYLDIPSDPEAATHISSSFYASQHVDGSAGLREEKGKGYSLFAPSLNACGWMFAHYMKCEAGPLLSKTSTLHFSMTNENDKSQMTNEKQDIPEEDMGLEM